METKIIEIIMAVISSLLNMPSIIILKMKQNFSKKVGNINWHRHEYNRKIEFNRYKDSLGDDLLGEKYSQKEINKHKKLGKL